MIPPIEFKKDVNGNIDHQIRLNHAMLNGIVEASCDLYEDKSISAEEALRDIREALEMHKKAWDILTNTKSDYAGKQ